MGHCTTYWSEKSHPVFAGGDSSALPGMSRLGMDSSWWMCQVPLTQALQKLLCLQGCCRAGSWGSEYCAAKISSAGGSWSSWVCFFFLLPCLGRSQMPPQGACAMAVPGFLLQQAGEEEEIKGGFQQTVPFFCPEVSLLLPAGKSHTSSALSHGFNSKLLLAQHHLALILVSL